MPPVTSAKTSAADRKGPSVLILAGEVSGDLHAAGLIREFKKLRPDVHFFGTGGDRMAAEGCENLYHVRDIAFLGFAEVVRHLPFIRRMMLRLLDECRQRLPQAVVLVDYPGFNLRFAARLRRIPELRSVPILYYISPQVWAWHTSRIHQITRLVSRMAVIFDFEVPLYRSAGLEADFVGHPLLDVVQSTTSREAFQHELGFSGEDQILALAPGSRLQEIRLLFPLFLKVYGLLQKSFPAMKAVVACSPAVDIELYRSALSSSELKGAPVQLLTNRTYDILACSRVALVASGTVTLEAAILNTPMVMAYRVAPLTYWIGRYLVNIPNIALVNVVAGKKIVPEFIQNAAQPDKIAAELADLWTNAPRRDDLQRSLAEVKAKLGQPGASQRVATLLQAMMRG